MSKTLPEYSFPEITGGEPVSEGLGIFEDILDGVSKEGFVDYAPRNKKEAYDSKANMVRNRTIATRLWLLGYLDHKPDDEAESDELFTREFRNGVERFQEEAGLTIDRWVGDETWYALDELVSFESETDASKWYRDGSPLPALERAIQLRLFSFGLCPAPPDESFSGLHHEVFEEFNQAITMFNLLPSGPLDPFSPEYINLLFDEDGIVSKLAEAHSTNSRFFTYTVPPGLTESRAEEIADKFLINAAKVELWLLGFRIAINGAYDYSVSGSGSENKNPALQAALVAYWKIVGGKGDHEADEAAETITPGLFLSFRETIEESRTSDHQDYSREIEEEFAQRTDDWLEEAWQFIRKTGLSLWDGLRRVWGWIRKGVSGIISSLQKNVFRAFFRYASKAFKIVKMGITSVLKGVDYYVRGILPGSSFREAAVLHDKDFDFTVFVSSSAHTEQVFKLGQKMRALAALFRLGVRIVGLAFNVFIGMGTGAIGWARILLTLVRCLRDLKPIYAEMRDYSAVLLEE